MAKLLELRPDSKQSGFCKSCIHLVDDKCDCGKPCGQVMACRCQAKAMVVGRFPNGRVRKTPLKRVKSKKKVKVQAWEETYKRMAEISNTWDCVWIGLLTRSNQVTIRRHIKRGTIRTSHIAGVLSRKQPATFIELKDLYEVLGDNFVYAHA